MWRWTACAGPCQGATFDHKGVLSSYSVTLLHFSSRVCTFFFERLRLLTITIFWLFFEMSRFPEIEKSEKLAKIWKKKSTPEVSTLDLNRVKVMY
jgi:hypothetical protein